MMICNIIAVIGAYLVGSIPTGYLIAQWAGIADIRKHGSGNIGATNVARALGVHFFFIVFFIDAIKAFTYVRYMQSITPDVSMHYLIAVALLLGNIFSLFLGFRGGKGVATSVGIGAALMPALFGYVLIIWLAMLAITKTVGIASVVGGIALPILASYSYGLAHMYALLSITIAVTLLITHRENLARFLRRVSF
jgi:glycerol-3-phosphate acyltransferase PlsY